MFTVKKSVAQCSYTLKIRICYTYNIHMYVWLIKIMFNILYW